MSNMKYLYALIISAFFLLSCPAFAQPYLPKSDDEVLETLPRPQGYDKIITLSQQHKLDPANIIIGAQLVEAYIALGKKEADPRYYGYAEAVLKIYLNDEMYKGGKLSDINAILLTDYANILQHQHKFAESLELLNKIIQANPSFDQPRLLRAVIYITEGNYKDALSDCRATLKTSGIIIGTTCLDTVDSMTGKLKESYNQLKSIYEQFSVSASDDEKSWALAGLGDLASRLGDSAQAEKYYVEGLKINPRDYYILASYTDILLEQNRNDEVIKLLETYTRLDNLLLRLTFAEKKLGSAKADEYAAMMEARLAASRERKEMLHLRDFARYALDIKHDGKDALEMARENWKTQREPADSYILLDSALAENDSGAVKEVLDWLGKNGFEDVRMAKYKGRAQ